MYANRNRNLTETVVHTSHLMPCARLLPPLQKECFGSSFATPCPFLHQRNRLISMDQSKKCEPAFFFLRVCGFAFFFLTLSHLRLHFCKPSFCEQQDWRSSLPHRFFFPSFFPSLFLDVVFRFFFIHRAHPFWRKTQTHRSSFSFLSLRSDVVCISTCWMNMIFTSRWPCCIAPQVFWHFFPTLFLPFLSFFQSLINYMIVYNNVVYREIWTYRRQKFWTPRTKVLGLTADWEWQWPHGSCLFQHF